MSVSRSSSSKDHNNVVGDHYQIIQKIGCGSFGEIYSATDLRTNERVAAKVVCELNNEYLELHTTKHPQLLYEYTVYRAVSHVEGIPRVRWCGASGKCNVMIMDLLGDSLESLFNRCGRKFTLKTVIMLGLQLLDRIQEFHDNHFLHRDIKPDNFLMGLNEQAGRVYMIDMGLSKRFRDPLTLEHVPFKDKKKLTGTPRYASVNTHLGIEQSRRDDLESLGYILLYFLSNKLPWQGLKASTKQEKYDKIGEKKQHTPLEVLCRGQPVQFLDYFRYCRRLDFDEEPNYEYLRELFRTLFRQCKFDDDGIFDWMERRSLVRAPRLDGTAVTQSLLSSIAAAAAASASATPALSSSSSGAGAGASGATGANVTSVLGAIQAIRDDPRGVIEAVSNFQFNHHHRRSSSSASLMSTNSKATTLNQNARLTNINFGGQMKPLSERMDGIYVNYQGLGTVPSPSSVDSIAVDINNQFAAVQTASITTDFRFLDHMLPDADMIFSHQHAYATPAHADPVTGKAKSEAVHIMYLLRSLATSEALRRSAVRRYSEAEVGLAAMKHEIEVLRSLISRLIPSFAFEREPALMDGIHTYVKSMHKLALERQRAQERWHSADPERCPVQAPLTEEALLKMELSMVPPAFSSSTNKLISQPMHQLLPCIAVRPAIPSGRFFAGDFFSLYPPAPVPEMYFSAHAHLANPPGSRLNPATMQAIIKEYIEGRSSSADRADVKPSLASMSSRSAVSATVKYKPNRSHTGCGTDSDPPFEFFLPPSTNRASAAAASSDSPRAKPTAESSPSASASASGNAKNSSSNIKRNTPSPSASEDKKKASAKQTASKESESSPKIVVEPLNRNTQVKSETSAAPPNPVMATRKSQPVLKCPDYRPPATKASKQPVPDSKPDSLMPDSKPTPQPIQPSTVLEKRASNSSTTVNPPSSQPHQVMPELEPAPSPTVASALANGASSARSAASALATGATSARSTPSQSEQDPLSGLHRRRGRPTNAERAARAAALANVLPAQAATATATATATPASTSSSTMHVTMHVDSSSSPAAAAPASSSSSSAAAPVKSIPPAVPLTQPLDATNVSANLTQMTNVVASAMSDCVAQMRASTAAAATSSQSPAAPSPSASADDQQPAASASSSSSAHPRVARKRRATAVAAEYIQGAGSRMRSAAAAWGVNTPAAAPVAAAAAAHADAPAASASSNHPAAKSFRELAEAEATKQPQSQE